MEDCFRCFLFSHMRQSSEKYIINIVFIWKQDDSPEKKKKHLLRKIVYSVFHTVNTHSVSVSTYLYHSMYLFPSIYLPEPLSVTVSICLSTCTTQCHCFHLSTYLYHSVSLPPSIYLTTCTTQCHCLHLSTYMYHSVSLSPSIYLPVPLSVTVSIYLPTCTTQCHCLHLSTYLYHSVSLSIYLSTNLYHSVSLSPSIYLPVPLCHCIHLSMYLPVPLSVTVSIYLPVPLSVTVSIYLPTCTTQCHCLHLCIYLLVPPSVTVSIFTDGALIFLILNPNIPILLTAIPQLITISFIPCTEYTRPVKTLHNLCWWNALPYYLWSTVIKYCVYISWFMNLLKPIKTIYSFLHRWC